jgi:hypothetical protein
MATKTVHVYPSDGAWAVKKGGKRADIFVTRREAVEVAFRNGKKARTAQIVVHGQDGRVQEHRTYGMPKVQDPPKRGRLASRRIAKAVGKVVLDRLHSNPLPPRAHTPAK